jgi:5-methylthioadenosine/S-adenosylhomocysteine deaminase
VVRRTSTTRTFCTRPENKVETVDLIINKIDWLITVDSNRRVIRDGAIAVKAGRIVAVGKSDAVAKDFSAARMVDGSRTVATPGLIDCHLHASFQLSRGLADEANAQSFLFERMYPYEAALDGEDVRVSATLAAAELLKHGVTCFIDPGNYHPEASVEGVIPTGIRYVVSRSSFDLTKSVLGILPERMIESTEVALERAEAVLERYANSGNPRLSASASFRGLNNASDELILGLDRLARKHGTLLQTHACFSYSTHDSSVARTGMAEIERLERLGVIDERMLIVHSGWLEPEEVAILAKRKPSLVCAPSSSLHNGYGNFLFGKLPELLALGVNVTVGSDHASSGIVDMPQEMRLACCCYKETRINPRVMPPETGLEMATVNGAKAALMGDRIGSIEVGREADIVLFDTRRPEWQQLINPVANLVYSATGDSVRDVFVAGEQVVAGGTLTKIDEAKLYADIPLAVARFGKQLKFEKMVQLRWPVS